MLAKYFNSSVAESFIRQLHMYGFKSKKNKKLPVYYHSFFLRKYKQYMFHIKRKKKMKVDDDNQSDVSSDFSPDRYEDLKISYENYIDINRKDEEEIDRMNEEIARLRREKQKVIANKSVFRRELLCLFFYTLKTHSWKIKSVVKALFSKYDIDLGLLLFDKQNSFDDEFNILMNKIENLTNSKIKKLLSKLISKINSEIIKNGVDREKEEILRPILSQLNNTQSYSYTLSDLDKR